MKVFSAEHYTVTKMNMYAAAASVLSEVLIGRWAKYNSKGFSWWKTCFSSSLYFHQQQFDFTSWQFSKWIGVTNYQMQ